MAMVTTMEEPLDENDQRCIYVPFLTARNYIAKMEDDFGGIAEKRSTIFEKVQTLYRMIEEETRERLLNHMKSVKTEYETKLSYHKRIIAALREELNKNTEHVKELETDKEKDSKLMQAALLEKDAALQNTQLALQEHQEKKTDLEAKLFALEEKLRLPKSPLTVATKPTPSDEIMTTEGKSASHQSQGQQVAFQKVPRSKGSYITNEIGILEDLDQSDAQEVQPSSKSKLKPDAVASISTDDSSGKKMRPQKILSDETEEPKSGATKIQTKILKEDTQNVADSPKSDRVKGSVIFTQPPYKLPEDLIDSNESKDLTKELERLKKKLALSNEERDSAQQEVLRLREEIPPKQQTDSVDVRIGGERVEELAPANTTVVGLPPVDIPDYSAIIRKYEEEKKRHEKILMELEKKYDLLRVTAIEKNQEMETKDKEISSLKSKMSGLNVDIEQFMNLQKQLKSVQSENAVLFKKYSEELYLHRKYYNEVEDMKGKIRVYIRVRPISHSEQQRNCKVVARSPNEYTIELETHNGLKKHQFDHIFMPQDSQEAVFKDTRNLIQSAVDGYNVCIIAYGQTGSGKTFTMDGDMKDTTEEKAGLSPRAFKRIFEIIREKKDDYRFKVSVYMIENYMDKLVDLLRTSSDDVKLEPKLDENGMVYVPYTNIREARSELELQSIFEAGKKNRHLAATKMNEESSRSHLILSILIESENLKTGQRVFGKLSLIDLAGSERQSKTEASGQQLKEANEINKSLTSLGNVIAALGSKEPPGKHIYRQSILTMLLQDSIGGNAKTLMFINLSPVDYNAPESNSSLTFAAKVKNVTNQAQKNTQSKEVVKLKAIIEKLKKGENVDE